MTSKGTLACTARNGKSYEIPLLERDAWISQNDMIELAGRDRTTVSRNIYNTIKDQ
jgi:hypothetical protein